MRAQHAVIASVLAAAVLAAAVTAAESIVNPNAVIVAGPGYTGPDGRSTMPDYRERLSVADLEDLVAYLEAQGGEHGHRP